MASIQLDVKVSLYPTVWHVVLKDSGLPVGEVVDSVWATRHLAILATQEANERDADKGLTWEFVECPVGNEIRAC